MIFAENEKKLKKNRTHLFLVREQKNGMNRGKQFLGQNGRESISWKETSLWAKKRGEKLLGRFGTWATFRHLLTFK